MCLKVGIFAGFSFEIRIEEGRKNEKSFVWGPNNFILLNFYFMGPIHILTYLTIVQLPIYP